MPLRVECDYCGDEVAGEIGTLEVGAESGGNGRGGSGRRFYFHAGGEDGGCQEIVLRMLEDIASWAHSGQEGKFSWKLERLEGPARSRQHYPIGEEYERRVAAGTPLAAVLGRSRALIALRRADLVTLEECTAVTQRELLAIEGIGTLSVKAIETAMAERGLELKRGPSALEVGDRIRHLRTAAGISARELARAVSVDRGVRVWEPAVREWERGKKVPSEKLLYGVANALGVPVGQLLEGGAARHDRASASDPTSGSAAD
jgi:DNA-binding transcriptional regulator YiaG